MKGGINEEYGKALFLLAEEASLSDRVKEDVELIKAVLKENPEFPSLLDTPAIPKAERLSMIDSTFGSLCELTVNTAKLLAEGHSFYLLPRVCDAFLSQYEASRGIEHAEVVSARPLTEEQLSRLREKLEAQTGKTIIINALCDPRLLGGVKLRYMGKQLDGSLQSRLERLERQLAETIV